MYDLDHFYNYVHISPFKSVNKISLTDLLCNIFYKLNKLMFKCRSCSYEIPSITAHNPAKRANTIKKTDVDKSEHNSRRVFFVETQTSIHI